MKKNLLASLLAASALVSASALAASAPANVYQVYQSADFVGSDSHLLGGPTFLITPAFPNTIVGVVANTSFQTTGAVYNNVVQLCYNPNGQACPGYGNNNLAFMLSGPKPGFVLHAAATVGNLATWPHGHSANWDKNFTFETAPDSSERDIVSGFLTLP